ncbi:hypothetical protein Saso_31930 [Streptomyces asoensis]|uniref:Transposase n=1 Tax=Streptomyces asoensis TaxID=249586 RepID=A0ABQ3S0B9_9ACTN|nr:hypothetical protein GCM10010496_25260 [Streptomyces asoensis]GHI61543.1 hypothetical protein Saso_31930 [Streptomyces asoensis]
MADVTHDATLTARDSRVVAVVGVSEGNEGSGAGGKPLGIRRIWQWAREGASKSGAANGGPP